MQSSNEVQFLWWVGENEGDPRKLRHLVFSLSKCESSAPSVHYTQTAAAKFVFNSSVQFLWCGGTDLVLVHSGCGFACRVG